MMAQYLQIKAQSPDALLFYRMGDFYELFFDDARRAAAALDIALTKRGKHLGEDIPMCGVPVVSSQTYLSRLIAKGFKVAVCEQTEAPQEAKKRGAKSVVKRAIVRIVTPGTLTEETLLPARQSSRIAAVHRAANGSWGLAWADITSGEFCAAALDGQACGETLAALHPREILYAASQDEHAHALLENAAPQATRTPLEKSKFNHRDANRKLSAVFAVTALDAFGDFTPGERAALGALYGYLEFTQPGQPVRLDPPKRLANTQWMAIDPASRASLELVVTQKGSRKGSLLSVIDRTVTAPGARLFADRLSRPSCDRKCVEARLAAVDFFVTEPDLLRTMREALKACPDGERALSRLALGRGGPRDLAMIGQTLKSGEALNAALAGFPLATPPPVLAQALDAVSLAAHADMGALARDLEKALREELPVQLKDGGFIAKGWSKSLDSLRDTGQNARREIAVLQARYAKECAIPSLKIKHNNVLGYFVDVTPRHAPRLLEEPLCSRFTHRQTLAGAVRFTTEELADLDAQIAGASERILAMELEIFAAFAQRIEEAAQDIARRAHALAVIDVAAGAAWWAIEHKAVRPHMCDEPVFAITGGRHPVVEEALRAQDGEGFTANDCTLDARGEEAPRLSLVTGPNMAGKSTFLRQNALIAILAQAGLFVPARAAKIGMVDRVFSRVGASDDLGRGRSTFMTEMIETAAILNQSGPGALVILDEIGRGTSTFDGLAIAWAVSEHLYEVNQCRTLFATHYHELTRLAEDLPGASNLCLRAREWEGNLIFLHQVANGAADRSYGVQVARLAGLPPVAVARAEALLKRLENKKDNPARHFDDLPLFSETLATAAAQNPVRSATLEALGAADIDALSPREALDYLYELQDMARQEKDGQK